MKELSTQTWDEEATLFIQQLGDSSYLVSAGWQEKAALSELSTGTGLLKLESL